MQWLIIAPGYFLWHYTRALRAYTKIWFTWLWFINRLFSIPLLVRTLFSPWKRITEDEPTGFDIERFFENVAVNVMSRLVGAFVRIPLIILGLAFWLSAVFIGIGGLVLWLVAPVALLGMFLWSFALFI